VESYDDEEDAILIAENLRDWVENEKRGEFTCNILRDDEIRFLLELDPQIFDMVLKNKG
jgi:hypothetical protein